MGVGHNIRLWRERRGYDQAELARLAGIKPNTLWRIEKLDRKPRGPTLRKLADLLSVDVSVLQGVPDAAR